jgi:hypothetical protein
MAPASKSTVNAPNIVFMAAPFEIWSAFSEQRIGFTRSIPICRTSELNALSAPASPLHRRDYVRRDPDFASTAFFVISAFAGRVFPQGVATS